jgi:hypothetical protein
VYDSLQVPIFMKASEKTLFTLCRHFAYISVTS